MDEMKFGMCGKISSSLMTKKLAKKHMFTEERWSLCIPGHMTIRWRNKTATERMFWRTLSFMSRVVCQITLYSISLV